MNTKIKKILALLASLTVVGLGIVYFTAPQVLADTPISGYFLNAAQYAAHTPIPSSGSNPGTYSLLVDAMNNLRVAEDFLYSTVSTTNSTTTLKIGAGLLHTVTGDTVASGTVLTLYDTTSTTLYAAANATGTITITATSTSAGTVAATINGFIITSAPIAEGSTSAQAASALASAISAFPGLVNVLSASASSNVINFTSTVANVNGNFTIGVVSSQLGLSFAASTTASQGTPIIAKITTNGSVPETLTYDTAYNYGLLVTETGATSTFTISSE